MAGLQIHACGPEQAAFLSLMVYETAFWRAEAPDQRPRPSLEEALELPEIARYVRGWGREGDRGLAATVGSQPVGAVWYRRFPADDPGYGFVDEDTPEVSIAVVRPFRGMGVGRALLSAALVQARLDAVGAMSLSVEEDNPAVGLYLSVGFRKLQRLGNAWTMVARLGPQDRRRHRS